MNQIKTLHQARHEHLSTPQQRHLSMSVGHHFTEGWNARQAEIDDLKQTLELVIAKCQEAEKIACETIKQFSGVI